MIDLLSWCVLFSLFRPCDWFSREQFLSTCTCAYTLFIKGQKANSLEDIIIIVQAEKVYFVGRVLFCCPEEERGRIFATRKLLTSCGHKSDEALARKIPPAIFSDPLYGNSIPTLQHCTPARRRVWVSEGGGGRHTLVQAIQSGFSTGYLAAQRFRICVPINEGGSQPHIFATELCVA